MKKCQKCGVENKDDCRFCKECGNAFDFSAEKAAAEEHIKELAGYRFRPVPDEEIQALLHKKTPFAEKLILTLAASALIIGAVCLVCNVRGGQRSGQLTILSDNGKITFLCGGEPIEGSLKNIAQCELSADETAGYAINQKGVLYTITGKGVEKTTKNAVSAMLSPEGDSLLYTDKSGVSWLCTMKNGKSKKISHSLDMSTAVFSPDGKTLAYNDEEDGSLYIFRKGDSEKLDDNVTALAVSDGGKRIYAAGTPEKPELPEKPDSSDFDSYDLYKDACDIYDDLLKEYSNALQSYQEEESFMLYYYPSCKAEKRALLCDNASESCYFNEDISEIVFRTADDSTLWCKKGGKAETISKISLSPFTDSDHYSTADYRATVYSTGSLLGLGYTNSFDTLVYVDKKGKSECIAKDIGNPQLPDYSDNGRNICFINSERNLCIADTKKGNSRKVWSSVVSFAADSDFGTIYVLQQGGDLYILKEMGSGKYGGLFVDSNVIQIFKAPSGGVYYLRKDKKNGTELRYSKNSHSSEAIECEKGFSPASVRCYDSFALYTAYNPEKKQFRTYISEKGSNKFKKCTDSIITEPVKSSGFEKYEVNFNEQ